MQDWERRLAQAGYRLTAARRAVIDVMATTTVPLSPPQIRLQARARCSGLGLVTVYRTLDLLEALDLVRRVHLDGFCRGYVPASPGHCHAILCRRCGRATEFPGSEDLEGLVALVQHETGYQVEDHLLQLVGLCPSCQA